MRYSQRSRDLAAIGMGFLISLGILVAVIPPPVAQLTGYSYPYSVYVAVLALSEPL
jgi:cytosine/uracil/thiamine/allantoin permease